MIEHPTPQLVAITGSVRAGMEVARAAASDLKRVHLELGGKAPVIVFPDADLEKTVEGIATAGYFNAGQDCTAATRLLVHEDVHDDFVEALVGYVAQQHLHRRPARCAHLLRPGQQRRAARAGHGDARCAADARRGAHRRRSRDGTRLLHRTDDRHRPRTTGRRHPERDLRTRSSPCRSSATKTQALAWANGVHYGLSSSVWTADHGRAMRFAKQLDFGCVWINTHIPIVAEMPHGGFKHSGYGKDLSMYGFEDYTRIKHVMSYIG